MPAPGDEQRDRHWLLATRLLLALAVVLAVLTYRDYGVSFDESVHGRNGRAIVHHYTSLGSAPYEEPNLHMRFYGGAFDATAEFLGHFLPLPRHDSRHLLNALIGILGVLGTARLGRRLGGPAAGFWSAAALLVVPAWYGHQFMNPKDIPFAAGCAWSLALALDLAAAWPRVAASRFLAFSGAAGLTLGVRAGGVLVFLWLGLALGERLVSGPRGAELRRLLTRATLTVAASVVLAGAVMLLFWPWAQAAPLSRPFEGLTFLRSFPFTSDIMFDGEFLKLPELPWSYAPRLMLLTLPEGVLSFLTLGCLLGAVAILRRSVRAPVVIVLLAALVPVLLVAAGKVRIYDGWRHLLFVLPPLAVLAGTAISCAIAGLGRHRWAAHALCGLVLVQHVPGLIRLHPYEYVSFNRLAGGLPGAADRFETEYWLTSYREAVLRLADHVVRENGGAPPAAPVKVRVAVYEFCALPYFPPFLELAAAGDEPRFSIVTTRWRSDASEPGRVLFTVGREGVPFTVVKELR